MSKPLSPFDPERSSEFGAPGRPNFLETRLREYVPLINEEVQTLVLNEREAASAQNDPVVRATKLAYLDILEAASSRRRGVVTMFAHLDWGVGGNLETGLAAAVHGEMGQASFLILDDIHDGAESRRKKPVAHLQVETALEAERDTWVTSPPMSRQDIENVTALRAVAYQILSYSKPFAHLPVRPRYLSDAMDMSAEITNITADGQIRDISNRRNTNITEAELLDFYVEKTALYTFAAPLIIGKTLADGPLSDVELHYIYEFAKPAGTAFQLGNDLELMEPSDKPDEEILLDIHNGTMTPLVLHALHSSSQSRTIGKRISDKDRTVLWRMLHGKGPFLLSQTQNIFRESGAVDHVQELIEEQKKQAQDVLDEAAARCNWPPHVIGFLRQLAL